jgi:hypothetical protein
MLLPLVVALVIHLDAFPRMPNIQIGRYDSEGACIKAKDDLHARYPNLDFHWSCGTVNT